VTRFAPSPTGYLHLGHIANAVWTWGLAQAAGGRVLLRIEDHDRGRCRPEFERAILDDLDWLGLTPDPESRLSLEARPSPYRQSDNGALYGDTLRLLRARVQIFACRCSRKEIAARLAEDGLADWDELRYPGSCRSLGLTEGPGSGIRMMVEEETVEFTDLRLGAQRQRPALQCGDLLLRDTTGSWTYQFCVTVDDWRSGVNLVIRGEDLLPSTGRQLLLGRRLGRATPPAFLHHPLIRAPGGGKLSKRDGATGVRELRAAGRRPEDVLGQAAYLTGLLPEPRPVAAAELGSLFG
ncbi:MAG: tRNA glutamyl-Q(34) synthetase GluQRS, partial [Gemmatimonadales bacterium]|nr:tRNA glutamyl-Q(34) synthetase GluQRS [Gemmatimonadales bacterium]